MNVDPPNSISGLPGAISRAGASQQHTPQPQRDHRSADEPGDVELQLSDDAADVPKHQRPADNDQAGSLTIPFHDSVQSDDDRLDVTV